MADRENTLRRDESGEEEQPTFWSYLSIPRLIFFTIVIVYLLSGASVLHILERGDDSGTKSVAKSGAKPSTDLTRVVEQLWDDSQNEEISEDEWKKRTKIAIEKIDADDDDEDEISWTFAQSFLYTTASLTRIGSTVQPETFFGRIFVLFYTVFGIPLLLIFFADLGKFFVNLLQTMIEHAQHKLRRHILPSISTETGDIDAFGFVLVVSAVLSVYVVCMSFFFRVWCGGSIFGNIYTAFLIVFGVGPAPIDGTETCANTGVFSFIPAITMVLTAPIAWSLTNMQTDLLGTEYIRKLHMFLRKIKQE